MPKNIYFLTPFDNRINFLKRIIFFLLKVRFFKFKKNNNINENLQFPEVNFYYGNEIIQKFLQDCFFQEKENFLHSISKGKALDKLFKKFKIISVFSNISRGEYGYYLELAGKHNVDSINIPHGTLAENFNEYDKIYKNTKIISKGKHARTLKANCSGYGVKYTPEKSEIDCGTVLISGEDIIIKGHKSRFQTHCE